MKSIGYIRVSSEEQAQSGLSLAHQRAKIEAYCLATDIELVGIIEDAGRSAKTMQRPGLLQALDMLKAKQADALVILKLDRLTRSVKDLGELVELFDKSGSALISVQDSINTDTAAGRLVLNVLGSVAQWEREAICERTKAALAVKKAKRERVGSVPYGYDLAADGRTLTPNSQELAIIETMRALRSAGRSYSSICSELVAKGITTKAGGQWHAMTVRNICLAAV
jgi:site-specific DNA recombinase